MLHQAQTLPSWGTRARGKGQHKEAPPPCPGPRPRPASALSPPQGLRTPQVDPTRSSARPPAADSLHRHGHPGNAPRAGRPAPLACRGSAGAEDEEVAVRMEPNPYEDTEPSRESRTEKREKKKKAKKGESNLGLELEEKASSDEEKVKKTVL
ncbi:uncharacterized protein isoform X1 [Castor canadensis]|uniref:Uncharacterized protein isoform X1 n=1 Tax=Castor canadensis TaxID=51338 RepID=A0AC58KZS5_CASCN